MSRDQSRKDLSLRHAAVLEGIVGSCSYSDFATYSFIFYALQFGATFPREVRSALSVLVSLDNGFVITKVSFYFQLKGIVFEFSEF